MKRSVIGTHRSSYICKLKGHFVVEHEAVIRMRDTKKQERRMISRSHDHGHSDTVTRLVLIVALRGSLHWSAFLPRYSCSLCISDSAATCTSLAICHLRSSKCSCHACSALSYSNAPGPDGYQGVIPGAPLAVGAGDTPGAVPALRRIIRWS